MQYSRLLTTCPSTGTLDRSDARGRPTGVDPAAGNDWLILIEWVYFDVENSMVFFKNQGCV